MIRVLSRITTEPWAITREALDTIVEIAQRQNAAPQAVAAKLGRPLENSYAIEVRDRVAVIPVAGPLFRYANLFTELSGATSYDLLARDFTRAIEDPAVDAVLFNIDSPGGEANGVSEFADQVFAARGRKPITAYVDGTGASAAYWIASAADEVVIADTAQLGSIGTVMAVLDTRQRDEKAGVRRLEIVSSQSPHKRLDPDTDEGHRRLQARVDALSAVFIRKVAAHRGVSEATVTAGFGQGDVLVGEAAVAAGLADRIGHFEQVVSELRVQAAAVPPAFAITEERTMSETTAHAVTAATEPGQASVAAADADAMRQEQHAAGVRDGRAAERERVRAILTCEPARDRAALAQRLALDTDLDPEAAALLLSAASTAPPDGFARLDAAMRREGNAQVGADADPDATRDPGEALVSTARAMGLAK